MEWVPIRNVVVAVIMMSAACTRAENLLRNPGFESGGAGDVASWSVPSYWSGKLQPVTEGAHRGKRSVRLTPGESRGRVWGRMLHKGTFPVELAQPMRFSVWARGRGALLLGVIRYTKRVDDKPNYHYLWQEPAVSLTQQWQEVSFGFTVDDPRFLRFACCIELQGDSAEAILDEVALGKAVPDDMAGRVQPAHPMVPAAGRVDIEVRLTRPSGAPPPEGPVTVLSIPPEGGTVSRSSVELDAGGGCTYAFSPGPGAVGLWKIVLAHPAGGWARTLYADVLPAPEYALFESVAKDLPALSSPPHYLFLGDSLTDMFRGHNYVDKIGFWLQAAYGPKATVRNAGVGGDFITRVWDRLNRKPGTYRQAMYEGLFEPSPDRTFVFLGHNDSKASSRSNYTSHCVDPETFRRLYASTLEKLKEKTTGPVTVLTSTSSVYEITAESARKRREAGKPHNLFGKPEHLELFNRIAMDVAQKAQCDVLDVYGPTRDAEDKKSLFTPDGVHVGNRGNRLLALLILRHLTAQQ